MTWGELGQAAFSQTGATLLSIGTTFGLGGGAGLVTFLHHMPPPYEDQVWLGAIYDSFQDRAKNMDRIGKRRVRIKKEVQVPPA